ncbi:MAG: galactose mutarotase [Bacteroidetes bacterium]|nr:galactose mutarotase [Bacteroidota bacterium]
MNNGKGMRVTIINYGATMARIEVPDRNGNVADVLLGHEKLSSYIGGRFFLGATVGRYANRIAGARFVLDGRECRVTPNRNGNLLHGGEKGFDKKYWKAEVFDEGPEPSLDLSLVSPDGDEGFPGRMEVKVTYSISSDNELRIHYVATTDKTTVINLTNHSYFNLTGSPANTILDHVLTINADRFTATDNQSIPTGEMKDVAGTPLDFRKPTAVDSRIDEDYEQLRNADGYDKNWVLNQYTGAVREVASLYEPTSGRRMKVLTDQPGLQVYSGNYLDGAVEGKKGVYLTRRSGLCLECQHFPNSPNESSFPSTVLRPGQTYNQTTIYGFRAD